VENRNRRGLHAALRLPLSLLALGGGPAHVEQGLRVAGRTAILKLRAGSQATIKDRWERDAGISGTPVKAATWTEDARATRAANALADAWARRLHDAQQEALSTDEAIRQASKAIEPNVDRTAITESAEAFNGEIVRQNSYAYGLGYEVVETWSALLDACPRCWDLDGTTAVRPDRLPDPPLHPRCRCLIETSISPRDADAA
jgi:hypothetical protein